MTDPTGQCNLANIGSFLKTLKTTKCNELVDSWALASFSPHKSPTCQCLDSIIEADAKREFNCELSDSSRTMYDVWLRCQGPYSVPGVVDAELFCESGMFFGATEQVACERYAPSCCSYSDGKCTSNQGLKKVQFTSFACQPLGAPPTSHLPTNLLPQSK